MENVRLQPNVTLIPNIILDEWMPQLSPSEFELIMVIARQTYGWHKETEWIAYSQFANKTGLSLDSVAVGLKSLKQKQYIQTFTKEGANLQGASSGRRQIYYRINYQNSEIPIFDNKKSEIPSFKTRKIVYTKETNTKTVLLRNTGQSSKKPTCPLLGNSPLKEKYIHGHEECVEYLTSEETDRQQKFINRSKQFQMIHKILRAGYGFDVMDSTIRQVEKKYGKGAWDYTTLASWIEKGSANA